MNDQRGQTRVAREDALHAVAHAVYAESEFDEPRVPGHLRPTLFSGPPRQADGPLLEVMVEALSPGWTTALRGAAAAELGRDLLGRATGGRPALDPTSKPDQHSRVRQVRVPADLGAGLDAVARVQNRRVSDVMRDALAHSVSAHRAGCNAVDRRRVGRGASDT